MAATIIRGASVIAIIAGTIYRARMALAIAEYTAAAAILRSTRREVLEHGADGGLVAGPVEAGQRHGVYVGRHRFGVGKAN